MFVSRIAIRPYVGAVRSIVTNPVACSVGRSVGMSVCRSACHTSEPCKTAAPIEMPFGLRTWVGPGNHVLDGGPDPLMGLRRMGVPL